LAQASTSSIADTIAALADEIARGCPVCAERAAQIGDLVRRLEAAPAERAAIADAIEAETFAADVSDTTVRRTTEAVVQAVKGGV